MNNHLPSNRASGLFPRRRPLWLAPGLYASVADAALATLTRALKARYPIADIVGHSEIAPGRKSDPGPHFDWARYRAMLRTR